MVAVNTQSQSAPISNYEFVRRLVDTLVANRQVEIPVLPEVAARVVALSSGSDTNAQRLSRLITADPALASHVMRVAASAAYLPSSPLVSLQQAITWLGLAEVANIAFTVAVQSKLIHVPGQKGAALEFWRQSVATGVWAREIAGLAKLDPGAAYLCGLLHEIGKPVVLFAASDISGKTRTPLTPGDMIRIVNEFHVAVGEQIVFDWKLPEAVAVSLRYWSEPAKAPHYRRESAMVGLARHLADFSLNDDSDLARDAVLKDERVAELGLTAEQMTSLLNRTERVLTQVRTY